MYCKKCGKQYPDDAKFCGDCGTPLEKEEASPLKQLPLKMIIPVAAVVLVAAVGIGAFLLTNKKEEPTAKKQATKTEASVEQEIDSTTQLANTIASLNGGDYQMATIDVFAENYSPAPSDETAVWDKTLFYALEGYGDEGGYVNKNNCNLIRKQLKNAATGNIIQYEIYLNPNSGNPNKIVSIENVESGIDVMEYYYTEDGKINFIFMYSTDNYVTTYATPDKDGQRFLFNNDALCTWRVILDGGIANYVHGQNEADRLKDSYHSNEIFLYSDLSDEQKNQVNTYEKQMINAAYNTLNAVMAADGVATISGLAVDSNGNALPNAKIQLLADDKTTELFSCTTDDAGAYNILVPIADYNFNISVSYDGCLPCSIYDILINASNIEAYPDTAYMIPESDSEAEVQLTLGDAANYAEDGETLKRLSNAVINVRAGINNKLGDILYTFNSDENGYSAMSVKAGVYTIEVQATGYESMYYTVVSNPTVGTSSYSFYAAPELAEGQLAVVLTWGETPSDLDSHLFTSSGSDTQQVWYSNRSDDYGNWLDVDDTSSYGPETITISQFDASKYYKYCVVDFTNSSAGNANSTEMSYSGANVSVYNSNGLIASYNMPKNVNALVWEVFEIRNGVVSPIQRYYNNNSVENNDWWDGEKVKYENNEDLAAGLFGMEYIGNRRYTEHYQSLDGFAEGWTYGENIGMTLPSDEEAVAAVDRWDFDNDGKDEMLVVTLKPEYGLVERSSYGMYMLEQVADMSWEVADTVSAYTDVYCTYDNPERSEVFVMPDTHGDQVIYVEDYNYGNFADGEFFKLQSWIYDGAEFRNKYDTIEDAGSDGTLMEYINDYKTKYYDESYWYMSLDYFQPKLNLLHEMGFDPDRVGLEDSISSSEGDSRSILKIMRDHDVDWFGQYSDNYQGYMPDANGCFGYIYYKIYDYEDGKEQELS